MTGKKYIGFEGHMASCLVCVGGRGGRGSVKFASCKMHGAFTSDTPKHGHSMVICDMDKFNT
jgi:hypothetical protein